MHILDESNVSDVKLDFRVYCKYIRVLKVSMLSEKMS